jgi:hypothetical protein
LTLSGRWGQGALAGKSGGKRKMSRKIIIKIGDLDKEIRSFLKDVGADMPIDWNIEAIDQVKNAVVDAFKKMGVGLEIDDRLPASLNQLGVGRA